MKAVKLFSGMKLQLDWKLLSRMVHLATFQSELNGRDETVKKQFGGDFPLISLNVTFFFFLALHAFYSS